MAEMRQLKEQVPEIDTLTVIQTTGWVGIEEVVMMVVELQKKSSFYALMQSSAHTEISAKAEITSFS